MYTKAEFTGDAPLKNWLGNKIKKKKKTYMYMLYCKLIHIYYISKFPLQNSQWTAYHYLPTPPFSDATTAATITTTINAATTITTHITSRTIL